jgi:hypothetical protein
LGKGEQRRLCSRGKKKRTDNGEGRETTALGIGEEGRREKKAKSLPPPLVKAAQRWRNNLTGEVERFRKGEKKEKKKKKEKRKLLSGETRKLRSNAQQCRFNT